MASLTSKVANIDKRVSALEISNLDDSAGISRIVKNYNNVKVTVTITTNIHQYKVCSDTLLCSDTLII